MRFLGDDMPVPEQRLQALIEAKDEQAAVTSCAEHGYSEGWAICDGALVIYDIDDPPLWFKFERDENGNSSWDAAVRKAEWPR